MQGSNKLFVQEECEMNPEEFPYEQDRLSRGLEDIRLQNLYEAYLSGKIKSSEMSLVDLIWINRLLTERNEQLVQIYEELEALFKEAMRNEQTGTKNA